MHVIVLVRLSLAILSPVDSYLYNFWEEKGKILFSGSSRESNRGSQRFEVKSINLEGMAVEHMRAIHGSGWVWTLSELITE